MSIRVMVCHRHKVIAQGMAALLRQQPGLELLGPADLGPATLQGCEAYQPDVVVMGVESHSSEDLQLTQQLARQPLHTVVLADQASRSGVVRWLDAGARAYICNSSSIDELTAGIQSAAMGRVYLCQAAAQAMVDSARREQHHPGRGHCHLGARQEQVLRLIADGRSSKEIARDLQISPSTVEVHRRNIMRKVGLHKVAELTRYAIRHQLVSA